MSRRAWYVTIAMAFTVHNAEEATAAPRQQAFDPNLTYSYRTDQELLDASWSAQAYCMNNGSQRAVSNIRTNADGSRTVMFQCTPR